MIRPDAYIARFESSMTSSHPAVGTIAAVWRRSAASGDRTARPCRRTTTPEIAPLRSGSSPLSAMITDRLTSVTISVTISTR